MLFIINSCLLNISSGLLLLRTTLSLSHRNRLSHRIHCCGNFRRWSNLRAHTSCLRLFGKSKIICTIWYSGLLEGLSWLEGMWLHDRFATLRSFLFWLIFNLLLYLRFNLFSYWSSFFSYWSYICYSASIIVRCGGNCTNVPGLRAHVLWWPTYRRFIPSR